MPDEAIATLFGDQPAPAAPETQEGTPPAEDALEEVLDAQGVKIPKQFYREDGKHDIAGLAASWTDLRKGHAAGQARIKELEASLRTTDEPWEQYSRDFNYEGLKEAAPNAYTGADGEDELVMSLMRQLHEAGVPRDRARQAVAGYYGDMEKMIGPQPTDEQRRAKAAASLGRYGDEMVREVRTYLETRHAEKAFSEDELAVVGKMLQSGPALSFLHSMISNGRPSAPPSTRPGITTVADPERAKREALEGLAADNEEWSKNRKEILARYNAAFADEAA